MRCRFSLRLCGVVVLLAVPLVAQETVTVPVAAPQQTQPTAVPLPPPPPPPPANSVVIDAAHGGTDLGAKLQGAGTGTTDEKLVTLALGVRLRSLLQARGIPVVTTRESDANLDTAHRAAKAAHANAIACLSLHASMAGSGVHLYVSSLDAATAKHGWNTAQLAFSTRSLKLANVMDSALTHAGVHVTLGRTSLTDVDAMSCPAVAVEIAPLRDGNRKVTGGVDDDAYQASVAEAIAAALLEWRTEGKQ